MRVSVTRARYQALFPGHQTSTFEPVGYGLKRLVSIWRSVTVERTRRTRYLHARRRGWVGGWVGGLLLACLRWLVSLLWCVLSCLLCACPFRVLFARLIKQTIRCMFQGELGFVSPQFRLIRRSPRHLTTDLRHRPRLHALCLSCRPSPPCAAISVCCSCFHSIARVHSVSFAACLKSRP